MLAKQEGFNKCAYKDFFYECLRTEKTIFFGAVANQATIILNTQDNFSPDRKNSEIKTGGELSYHGILLEFSKAEKNKLENALHLDGWILDSSSATYKYYKENTAAYVALHQSFVALLPIQINYANEKILKIKQYNEKSTSEKKQIENFINFMNEK